MSGWPQGLPVIRFGLVAGRTGQIRWTL